ncbi:hypothetical protein GCM10023085_35270 [Actinomadura viridis]|uniref:SalK n=1 Tax=Actinomadura viridis TaxID=58110 RepID=A0A931GQ00_9ACTN|nr:hypothetical protein [Actinomadura viridis]MBG6087934.1 hypothetical protein [Actinomadura viridis]
MEDSYARSLWTVIEPLHLVTYFTPEALQANKDAGMKGFWMGYFGSRAAPMGPVPAGVVEATFYGFQPERVRKAVPDAWKYATPETLLRVREEAAAAALRRIAPGIDEVAAKAGPLLAEAVEAADGAARPLFSANRDVPVPADPVAALWQATTALREHRGDSHLTILANEGLSGIESVVLAAAVDGRTLEWITVARGWTEAELRAAVAALAERGLLDGEGAATAEGRAYRERIEERTNTLAAPPYRVLDAPEEMYALLLPVARAVNDSGELPFPNPVGLPRA